VIRLRGVAHILGLFLIVLAATMLVPLIYGLADGQGWSLPVLYSIGVTLAAGVTLFLSCQVPQTDLTVREGVLLVVAVWLAVSCFGGLPFYFTPHFGTMTDAFFEAASGFTTTGATVLEQVEVLPAPVQLWRCFSHWMGGMGIVLLGIAILPLLGAGGMQLYRAEFSGAKSEKLKPRITETALALWKIYAALTLAEYVALRWAGMGAFEAACHTFSTLGTGGFSTRTASVAAFQSPLIEYIIVGFMLLAGVNFTQHYRLFVERRVGAFFRDIEIKAYAGVVAVATAVIAMGLAGQNGTGLEPAVRAALFQVASITTTTGFATADFEQWKPLAQLILLALMFIGGCTGSTAGGLKVSRLVLLAKVVNREFKQMVERRGVFSVRLGSQVIAESSIQTLLNLVYLAFMVNFTACLILAGLGADVLTSISAVAACMFNVGPGLGDVGPAEHYGHFPALSKWVLSLCMLAGRLEFYTFLVVVSPGFWRK
jgi:trk system potassium uptake protein TrkH